MSSNINANVVMAYLTLDTSRYKNNLQDAVKNLNMLDSPAMSASEKMQVLANSMNTLGSNMSKLLTVPLVELGKEAVSTFTSFDDSMRQVRATMNATEEDTAALTAAAKNAGATTRYTASEAASALNYLALAGYDSATAIESLPKVLQLAQAGSMDLAYASDLLTDSMAALGKNTDYMDTFADQMTRASQKSNTSISQLGEAILPVGGTAKIMAGDTAELATVLGLLADNGIKGSEGGTAFRNVLLSLTTPTSEAEKMLKTLGVSVYDASGDLLMVSDIMEDLNASMDGMTDEEKQNVIGTIFNKRDLAAVNALLGTTQERWTELMGEVTNSAGATEAVAETMEGGIGGSVRNLKSAIEAIGIEFGENLAPMVQNAADKVTELARGFANLTESQQNNIIGTAAVVASIGPALTIGAKAISLITKLSATMKPLIMLMSGPAGYVAAAAAVGAAIYKTYREVNNMNLHDKIQQTLDNADKEVTAEFTAIINTTIDIRNAEGGETFDLSDQLPSIYDAMKTALTDGKPDTENVLAEQEETIRAYYASAVEDVNKWRADELAKLDTDAADYEASVDAINAKSDELITSLNTLETESITWLNDNAGKATGFVINNMAALDAIQARAEALTKQIEAMTAKNDAELTAEEQRQHELIASGEVTDTESIVKDAAVGASVYAKQISYAEEADRMRQMYAQGLISPEMYAEYAGTGTQYNANEARENMLRYLDTDFGALASGTGDWLSNEYADKFSYADYVTQILGAVDSADTIDDVRRALDDLQLPEEFNNLLAEYLGVDPDLVKDKLTEEAAFGTLSTVLAEYDEWLVREATYGLTHGAESETLTDELYLALESTVEGAFDKLEDDEKLRLMWGKLFPDELGTSVTPENAIKRFGTDLPGALGSFGATLLGTPSRLFGSLKDKWHDDRYGLSGLDYTDAQRLADFMAGGDVSYTDESTTNESNVYNENITINMHGVTMSSQQDASKLGYELSEQIRQRRRGKGN